jgi:hypothetical protein
VACPAEAKPPSVPRRVSLDAVTSHHRMRGIRSSIRDTIICHSANEDDHGFFFPRLFRQVASTKPPSCVFGCFQHELRPSKGLYHMRPTQFPALRGSPLRAQFYTMRCFIWLPANMHKRIYSESLCIQPRRANTSPRSCKKHGKRAYCHLLPAHG